MAHQLLTLEITVDDMRALSPYIGLKRGNASVVSVLVCLVNDFVAALHGA